MDEIAVVPLALAVVQPTPFCNIDCRYCYLPERLDKRRMTSETLDKVFGFLLSKPERLSKHFTIAWHGGEPTTIPVSFYKDAFTRLRAMQPRGVHVRHKFTTNATLLNREWCSLFRDWQVSIRVSVDGPQWLHDRERVDRRGRGTFERVMRGTEFLRSAGVPFHTISVLRDGSLEHPDEVWHSLRATGASGFEFCIEESMVIHTHGNNSLARHERDKTARRMYKFFERLLALRDAEAPGLYIREVDTLRQRIATSRGLQVPGFETTPFSIVSITWDGKLSTFSPELVEAKHHGYGDFVFGDVATDSWDDVLQKPKFLRVLRDIGEGVENCRRTCEYFDMCGGGTPASKLFETDSFASTETLFCRLRTKTIGDLVLERFGDAGVSVLQGERGRSSPSVAEAPASN